MSDIIAYGCHSSITYLKDHSIGITAASDRNGVRVSTLSALYQAIMDAFHTLTSGDFLDIKHRPPAHATRQ